LDQLNKFSSSQKTQIGQRVLLYFAVVVVLASFMFPIYWMVSVAFKTPSSFTNLPPTPVWQSATFDNFKRAFELAPLLKGLWNSSVVALLGSFLAIISGALAGYSLERFEFKGRKFVKGWILGTQLVPPVVVVVPLFLLFFQVNLVGTRISLILANATFLTPLCTWMMGGFFSQIPVELEECARIDGASRLGALIRITLPLATPGLMATWTLTFIYVWNNFIFALPLTDNATQTLPVIMAGFRTDRGIAFGAAAAAGAITVIPVLAFASLTQKYLVRGLVQGALD